MTASRLVKVILVSPLWSELRQWSWVSLSESEKVPADGGIHMSLETSLPGRVRNTTLPRSHALLPLHEAVTNSFQAIDEQFPADVSEGVLTVRVLRSPQQALSLPEVLGPAPRAAIVGFEIKDNGIGFTDDNMHSFMTLDSDYKSHLGNRGVGRLLWLKAFDSVDVESVYKTPQGSVKRSFRFSEKHAVSGETSTPCDAHPGTTVHLRGFKDTYQTSAPKSGEVIARAIFEHCLWYFIRAGGAPTVRVIDESIFDLHDFLTSESIDAPRTSAFNVNGEAFELVSLPMRSSSSYPRPKLCLCAGHRVVSEDNLAGRLPGLHSRLTDSSGKQFTYVGYLTADFLDRRARADRTAFDVLEHDEPGLPDELSLDRIRSAALEKVANYLGESLEKSVSDSKVRVADFVRDRAPRYRPLLRRLEKHGFSVDPKITDKELELQLHRRQAEIEADVLTEGQDLLNASGDHDSEEFRARLDSYLEQVGELKQSDLAAYLTRRRVVLDLLSQAVEASRDGGYEREDVIHRLILPMRKDSFEMPDGSSNLWLIDERLAFHDYLASDKPLKTMPITDSESWKEPDILALKATDVPLLVAERNRPPLPSIVIVEIKRPMRNDAADGERNPIDQVLNYLSEIRDGKMQTANGRQIPRSEDIPASCYVIADLTPTMQRRCTNAGLTAAPDGMSYFGYNTGLKCTLDVISFDGLLNSATERNRAFFDKLGLPTA